MREIAAGSPVLEKNGSWPLIDLRLPQRDWGESQGALFPPSHHGTFFPLVFSKRLDFRSTFDSFSSLKKMDEKGGKNISIRAKTQ